MNDEQEIDQEELIEDIYYNVRDSETGLQYKKSISKSKRNCFTGLTSSFLLNFEGAELVLWIVQHYEVHKFIAEQIGQSLVDRYLIHKVSDESSEFHKREDEILFANDSTTYRFQEDDDPTILNFKRIYSGFVRSQSEIIEDMVDSILFLYKNFVVNEDGAPKPIDYKALKKSKEYRHFVNTAVELQMTQLSALKSEKAVLCFFTNLYNILLFHVCLDRLHPASISGNFQMNKSFKKCGYWIDGHKYSLFEIENGILRGNRKPIVFGTKDIRRNYAVQNFDAGIHFLLLDRFKTFTDATIPLKLFTPSNVFSQMQELTELLCNSEEVKVQTSKKTIILPKVFESCRTDFGSNKSEVLHWIANYVTNNPKKKEDLLSLIDDPQIIVLFYDPFEGIVAPTPVDEEQEAKTDEDDNNPVIEVQETRASTRLPNNSLQVQQILESNSEKEKEKEKEKETEEPKPTIPNRSQTPNLEWKTAKLDKSHAIPISSTLQRGRSFMIDKNSVYTKASISSYRSQSMDSSKPPSEIAKDEKPKESTPEVKKEEKALKRRIVNSFWGGKESIKQTLAPLKHIFDRRSIEKDEKDGTK